MINRYAVIMAGGRGERFWPLSTSRRPKQLLDLVGDKPLIAQAVERLENLIPPENIFVVTNADLVDATCAAAPVLPPENVVGEPMGRDTAPAVACGAALVGAREPDAVFCILTADQVIGDLPLFEATLREGMALAEEQDVLLTIGIQPDHPATGYGYIDSGEVLETREGVEFRKVSRFVEKPDEETARSYLDSGRFFWNSGMFIWTVKSVRTAFERHAPEMAELLDALTDAAKEGRLVPAMEELYPQTVKISVDYALMEKAQNIVVARGVFAWDDVGSWPALENHFEADAAGNTVIGDVEQVGSAGNIVYSKGRLTALVGVEDMIVVQADGVTLVCAKDKAQDIKKMVQQLRESGQYSGLL